MTLFVDTSGIIALVDRDDPAHAAVMEAFALGRGEPLVTHAYVVVETLAVSYNQRLWMSKSDMEAAYPPE